MKLLGTERFKTISPFRARIYFHLTVKININLRFSGGSIKNSLGESVNYIEKCHQKIYNILYFTP